MVSQTIRERERKRERWKERRRGKGKGRKKESDKVKIDVVGCFSLLPRIGVPPGCVRMKADGRLKRRRVSAVRENEEKQKQKKNKVIERE